jgi:hypothetical protein
MEHDDRLRLFVFRSQEAGYHPERVQDVGQARFVRLAAMRFRR